MHEGEDAGLRLPVFSRTELERRVQAVCAALPEQVEVVLLHTADSVTYLSGVPLLSEWGRPMWCILRRDGTGVSIGAEIERENMEANSVFGDVRTYADEEDVVQASLAIVREIIDAERSARSTGVEKDLLTSRLMRGLSQSTPARELVDISSSLAEARLVKSVEEIALLRIGGQVAKIGARAFLDAQHEGVSEMNVATEAVAAMNRALGAMVPNALSSSYAYCQSGLRSLTPHLHATGHALRLGGIVALNVFPVISGYCMELERTYVLGQPTEEQRRALRAVGEAFDTAKAALRPGLPMSEVDALARGVLEDHGLDGYIRHGTGHAHGIMVGAASREELGELRSYNPRPLAPRMVCSVEPGVYIPGVGGFRHSDVMLITDDAAECLTDFPRDVAAQIHAGDAHRPAVPTTSVA